MMAVFLVSLQVSGHSGRTEKVVLDKTRTSLDKAEATRKHERMWREEDRPELMRELKNLKRIIREKERCVRSSNDDIEYFFCANQLGD